MKFRVKVDQNLCTGCASCVAIAPDTFELNNEGKSVIRPGGKDSEEKILTAAQCCPANAIIIEEVNSKGKKVKKIWPV